MAVAPDPSEIFHRAAEEGERRLDQLLLELVSTSFIAEFIIVFGIAALGIVHALVEPEFGDVVSIIGPFTFGVGLVLLVVDRAELFNKKFFDPVTLAGHLVGGLGFVILSHVAQAEGHANPPIDTVGRLIRRHGHVSGT